MKFYGDLADRFVLEPRKDLHGCWLVVFDSAKEEYVKERPDDRKCRAYANFRSSRTAFDWLRRQIDEGKLL